MTFSIRPFRLAAFFLLCLASAIAQAQYTGIAGTVVRFANVAQGRELLARDDDWLASTSDFQRSALVGKPSPVSREQLVAFTAETVQPWSEADEARWRKALDAIAPRFAALHVPLPPEVFLVNTDGRDQGDAPYTRGVALMLPTKVLVPDPRTPPDPALLAHELFHIASRNAPAWSTRLYTAIGFESVAPLQWPADWLPIRIANPDAPFDRHAMRTTVDGRAVLLMPLIVASRTDLQPGESFFDVLDVRLLEVAASSTRPTTPVMRDGKPVWYEPAMAPEYLKRLGGNTAYIIHPEETMADNFALLVTRTPARNQALLDRIEALLLEPR